MGGGMGGGMGTGTGVDFFPTAEYGVVSGLQPQKRQLYSPGFHEAVVPSASGSDSDGNRLAAAAASNLFFPSSSFSVDGGFCPRGNNYFLCKSQC